MEIGLKPYMFVFYTLKYLSQKDKVKVLRQLQGYKENKYGKQYEHDGLVQKFNAEKIGSNVILVTVNIVVELQNFFTNNIVTIDLKEI